MIERELTAEAPERDIRAAYAAAARNDRPARPALGLLGIAAAAGAVLALAVREAVPAVFGEDGAAREARLITEHSATVSRLETVIAELQDRLRQAAEQRRSDTRQMASLQQDNERIRAELVQALTDGPRPGSAPVAAVAGGAAPSAAPAQTQALARLASANAQIATLNRRVAEYCSRVIAAKVALERYKEGASLTGYRARPVGGCES